LNFKIVINFEVFSTPNLFLFYFTKPKAENGLLIPAEETIAVWSCVTKSNVIILTLFFRASRHVLSA